MEEESVKNLCLYCKNLLVLRNGKNGEVYGCSNFPKCRYTENILNKQDYNE
jgi:ssDNA-binding Zn-finger/Zn-ribbon topoisomerase 1